MSSESPSILIVDDDPDIVKAARLLLERQGMAVTGAADPAAAWVRLAERAFDVVLLDLNFARGRTTGEEGFAMLDRLLAADRDAVVVVVTGHGGIAVAVQAMRAGASDFVIKPWSNPRLLATVERGVALRRARREVVPAHGSGEDRLLIGESAAIARLRALVARIAPTDAAVLVRGPAGSGKSLTARAIHHASARAEGPLTTVDCSAPIAPARVAEAGGTTVVLDGVEQLARADQAAAARALTGARVIATSRLDRAALRAALVDDLLYRVNTVEIDLPPLADRGEDALVLARHFLSLFAARYRKAARDLSDEAVRAIAADRWPDGVRGLRQAMERAVLLGSGDVHDVADLALAVPPDDPTPRAIAADLNLSRGERALVEAALKRHAFNVSRAATELGLTRAALYRRMAKYGL